jgi:hypothetical protein
MTRQEAAGIAPPLVILPRYLRSKYRSNFFAQDSVVGQFEFGFDFKVMCIQNVSTPR